MKKIYFLSLLLLLAAYTFAQTGISLSGKVVDTNKLPLEGATIRLKGTNVATITNKTGEFKINATSAGTLTISYSGFVTKEINFTQSGDVGMVILEDDQTKLDEVVVVGYGTAKKASLTAAISTIKGDAIAKQPVGDLSSVLAGRAPGVIFTQPSGQAGNDAATIRIRGAATTGNQQALYIVDGIPRNYNQLNPSDIESITLLKDAAAVAPYGLAGANGVILVTTKRGKIGAPKLSYDGWVGWQSPTVITELVNSYQFATMKNAAAINDGLTPPYTADELRKYQDGSDPDAYPNTNAFRDILKTNTLQSSHSLSLSGGSDKVTYAMGLGYYYQDGALPNLNYKRYNVSGNLQVEATKTTKVELALNGRVEDRNLTADGLNTTDAFNSMAIIRPNDPQEALVYSNGLHTKTYARFYDNESYQRITGNVLLSQFSIEQKLPLKGLSVKAVAAYDFNPTDPYGNTSDNPNRGSSIIQSFRRSWNKPYSYYTLNLTQRPLVYEKFTPTTLPSFSEEYHQTQAFTYQGYVNYANNFGKSAVTGLLVFELRNSKSSAFSAGRNNYNVPIPELFAGSSVATDLSNDGSSGQTKQRSLVYRATYAYDNKYLFEAGGRYDGHYYFAPGHRFGFFPAVSVGWRLSEESFMKNITWLSNLKLRASYGISGQLAGSPFQYQSAYSIYGNAAILSGLGTQGLFENTQANPNITWEKAKKMDIAIETSILKGLFTFEFDYFSEKRNNMLVTPNLTVPVEYGIGISQVNAGAMSNKGFEFSIGTNFSPTKDLNIAIDGNFTYAKNKLEQVFETNDTFNNPNRRKTGRALDTQFGYQALGYFTAADFDGSGNLKPGIATQPWGTVHPGDLRYQDTNGNGKIDVDDQVEIGKPTYPAIVYGFTPTITYKNFQLSLLFQGAAQKSIQLGQDAVWPFFNGRSAPITAIDYWTPDNPSAASPRITSSPANNNMQTSSWWQRSTAYLRLRTGNFSYTLPSLVSKKIGMSLTKIYVSGQNLITWTPLENFDPEISNNRGGYFPTMKSITIGLNAQF